MTLRKFAAESKMYTERNPPEKRALTGAQNAGMNAQN